MTMETEYEVTVIETFTRKITVRAHSKHEASQKVCEMYKRGDIALNDDDYTVTEFLIDGEIL